MDRISGADLKPGHVIKVHNRWNEVVEIEPSGRFGDPLGTFKLSNEEIVKFNIFADSTYELRDAMPGKRHRMVKVRAADLELVLSTDAAMMTTHAGLEAALQRLKEALR